MRSYYEPYNKRYEKCPGEYCTVIADNDVLRHEYTACLTTMAEQGFELVNQSGRVGYTVLKFRNNYGY